MESKNIEVYTSERLVRTHFERLGFSVIYEPEVGSKRPDFLLRKGDHDYALIEVENITSTPFIEELIVVDTIKALQSKINCAAKQLKYGKHLPCMIIVDGRGTMHMPDPIDVTQAMFGTEVFQVTMLNSGKIIEGMARASDGRMHRPGMIQPQNTTISAVGVWQNFIAIYEHSDDNWEGEELRLDTLPIWLRELNQLEWNSEDHSHLRRDRGEHIVVSVELLQIVLNPDARIPWPDDLRSPYDSVFEVSPNRRGVVRVIHGPTNAGIPQSYIFQDFDPFENVSGW